MLLETHPLLTNSRNAIIIIHERNSSARKWYRNIKLHWSLLIVLYYMFLRLVIIFIIP
jgi:hypothetical protein